MQNPFYGDVVTYDDAGLRSLEAACKAMTDTIAEIKRQKRREIIEKADKEITEKYRSAGLLDEDLYIHHAPFARNCILIVSDTANSYTGCEKRTICFYANDENQLERVLKSIQKLRKGA